MSAHALDPIALPVEAETSGVDDTTSAADPRTAVSPRVRAILLVVALGILVFPVADLLRAASDPYTRTLIEAAPRLEHAAGAAAATTSEGAG